MTTNRYLPTPYTRPSNFIGKTWEGYLVFLGRNRDSGLLDNHNFECALDALRDFEGVEKVAENHWACGWIEWIAIPEGATEAIRVANNLAERLDQYPVLDEDAYCNKEHEAACELWANMSVRERFDVCRKARVSGFAARRPTMESDRLYDTMRDYAAS